MARRTVICKHENAREAGQYWHARWYVALWCPACGALRRHWENARRFAKGATWRRPR